MAKISRRSFSVGLAANSICCVSGTAAHTNTCDSIFAAACALQENEAEAMGTSRAFTPQETLDQLTDSDIFDESGIEGFDDALKRVLTRLARLYRVFPDFKYINDSSGANAYAADSSTIPGRRGTIYFGMNMLTKQLQKERYGDMVVLAICGHEFSHIKQFHAKEDFSTAFKDKPCYATELHADFGTGYGLHQYLTRYQVSNSSLQTIGEAWSTLAPSEFNKESKHGTSAQRMSAIEAGYRYSANRPNANAEQALSDGIGYILSST